MLPLCYCALMAGSLPHHQNILISVADYSCSFRKNLTGWLYRMNAAIFLDPKMRGIAIPVMQYRKPTGGCERRWDYRIPKEE